MSVVRRFAFWLPLFSVIIYAYELIYRPVKHIIFAFDPLLNYLFMLFIKFTYDSLHFKILFPGFLLHFFLWLLYGLMIDYIIKRLFKAEH